MVLASSKMANLQVASVGDTFLDTFKRSRQSSQIFMPKTRQDSHGWNENQCKARKFVGHNCNYQSFFRDAIECKVKVKNDIMFFSDRKQIYKCQPRIKNFWLLICWVTPIRHKLLVKCLPPTKHLGVYQFGVNISHCPQFWPRSCMAIGKIEQTFPSQGNEKQRDSQHETMQKQNAIWTTHSSKKTRTGTNNLFNEKNEPV